MKRYLTKYYIYDTFFVAQDRTSAANITPNERQNAVKKVRALQTDDSHSVSQRRVTSWSDGAEADTVELSATRMVKKTSPRIIFGHTVRYWVLWTLVAINIAVWGAPLIAHFIHRFITPLW